MDSDLLFLELSLVVADLIDLGQTCPPNAR